VYLGIAVGSILNWFSVSNNVLLGLSIASLFISLGDTVDKLVGICIWRNIYEYSLYVTSCYLTEKIDNNVLPSISIDAYNVRLNIDGLRTNKQKVPSEPLKYQNKKRFGLFGLISKILFIIGIAIFVLSPFVIVDFNINDLSKTITIFAFAFMCINIFLGDYQQDIINSKNNCEMDKHLIIEAAFPGFINYYINRTQHSEAFSSSQKKKEGIQQQECEAKEDLSSEKQTQNPGNSILDLIDQMKKENNRE
jgi:hypothetical protein